MMGAPDADIEGCRGAHVRMHDAIAQLSDAEVGRASLLPGWTVGHVLTHVARNADAMCRRIDAAIRGVVVDQYPGGVKGRAAEIEQGAGRPAVVLVADVVESAGRLNATFASLPDDGWVRQVRTVGGVEHPVSSLPFRRWREVEIHLVDLDIGPTAADWTESFVERMMPRLMASLANRCDQRELMAWTLGRGAAPALDPWG